MSLAGRLATYRLSSLQILLNGYLLLFGMTRDVIGVTSN